MTGVQGRQGPGRRVARALGCAAVIALAALTATATPAAAHASLESMVPAQGRQLSVGPRSVSLHFSEAVGIEPESIEVLNAAGHRIEEGGARHVGQDAASVTVGLPSGLPKGSYAVVWHVVSADSHPVSGTYTFGVGVPAGTAPPSITGDPVVGALHAAFRLAAFGGVAVLIGGAFFLLVVWPGGMAGVRSRRLLVVAWGVAVVSACALFCLQGPYGTSRGLAALTDTGLFRVTLGGLFGRLLLLRLLALVVAAVVWRSTVRRGRLMARPDAAGLAFLVVESFSFAGHSGQGSAVPVAATMDALHLAAAGVWLGGLVVLLVALGPGQPDSTDDRESLMAALPRWSRVAAGAVSVLVVTGSYQAWREVGSVSALIHTSYGHLVVAKAAGLVVLLGLADLGRRWVRRANARSLPPARPVVPANAWALAGMPDRSMTNRPGGEEIPAPDGTAPGELRRLRRSVAGEVLVGIVVLTLTAALVNAVPARLAYAAPFMSTVAAQGNNGDSITVIVEVAPTSTGPQTVRLRAYTPSGEVAPFASADGTLQDVFHRYGPIAVTFSALGKGQAQARNVVVPTPGMWLLTVYVRPDVTTVYAAGAAYLVRAAVTY